MSKPANRDRVDTLTPNPLAALREAKVVVWVLAAGESLAAVLALAPGRTGDAWIAFGLNSLVIQWVALTTLALLYVLRDAVGRWRPLRQATFALGLALASTWVLLGLARVLVPEAWTSPEDNWLTFIVRMTTIVLALGLLSLAAFQNYWVGRQSALRAKQAELEALQARIRPHFLFNTLNTGAALVHAHPEAAERLLLDLADLFRAALAGPREIPLEEELALARRYIEIEALRFGDRLRVDWQLPRDIPRLMVPALSIQPLVENAIRHGVERLPSGGLVEIALTTTPENVVVRISNPLVFVDGRPVAGHRVGLNASQARIEALTGCRGSVQTGVQGERFVATVRLPRPRPANRR